MNHVKLKKLVIQDFRTFLGRHVIEFPSSGLLLVKGKNLETGGSSGSGKTNVLLALSYLLKICPFAATDLQSWHTKSPMLVEGVFETPSGEVEVRRGAELSVTVGGKKVKGAAKAVEAKLDEIMGVPAAIREILTYRDQKWPRNILSMKDQELKKFLTQVLSLEPLEAEVAVATKRIKDAEFQVELKEGLLELEQQKVSSLEEGFPAPPEEIDFTKLEQEVESACALLESLRKAHGDAHRAASEAAREAQEAEVVVGAKYDALRKEIEAELAKQAPAREQFSNLREEELQNLHKSIDECRTFLTKLRKQDADKMAELAVERDEIARTQLDLEKRLAQKPKMLAEVSRLERELTKLNEQVCPTCDQKWLEADGKVEELTSKLARARADLEETAKIPQVLSQLEMQVEGMLGADAPNPKIAKFEAVEKNLMGQVGAILTERAVAQANSSSAHAANQRAGREKIAALADRRALEVNELYSKVQLLRAEESRRAEAVSRQKVEFERATSNLKQKRAIHEATTKIFDDFNRRMERQLACVEGAKKLIAEYKKKVDQEVDYADLVKGFRNKVFDEVLQAIGAEATNILAELPNARHITVEFRSERETVSGSVEQRIKPVAFIHGSERNFDAASSGGQHTSVSLAVDLATIKVLSERLGCSLQWLVLDETFEGHDVVTKSACLEILQAYSRDKLVIVVDHATEVKEMFSQEVVVEYRDQKSKIS